MSIRRISIAFCTLMAIGFVAFAAEEKKFKATCPLSGKAALEDKTADYKGGKVYFCCGNCPGAFSKDPAKHAVKANQQLIETGQAKQTKCPLSGGDLNPKATVMVGDVKVQFCCEKCQAAVADLKGEEQAKKVFDDKPFDKAFEVAKKK